MTDMTAVYADNDWSYYLCDRFEKKSNQLEETFK